MHVFIFQCAATHAYMVLCWVLLSSYMWFLKGVCGQSRAGLLGQILASYSLPIGPRSVDVQGRNCYSFSPVWSDHKSMVIPCNADNGNWFVGVLCNMVNKLLLHGLWLCLGMNISQIISRDKTLKATEFSASMSNVLT